MIGTLYRYTYPDDLTKFIYVGQGLKRHGEHRSGKSSFGRRFKKLFPGVELPQPIREQVEVEDQIELNAEETIWMFRYHTWHAYPGGMNLTLPGSFDYKRAGLDQGRKNAESGHMQALGRLYGPIQGRKEVESGHLKIIAAMGGRVQGSIQGKKMVENGELNRIRLLPQSKEAQSRTGKINGRKVGLTWGPINGRKAVESGQLEEMRNLPHVREAYKRNGVSLGRKNVESGQVQELGRVWGRKAVESGRIQALGCKNVESGLLASCKTPESLSKGGQVSCCLRWNIRRNKPCVCGEHQVEAL